MINNKSVLAITLARGGSKGIPKKNIIDIHGKPLLQYTIDEVKKSKYIDHYVVSTDDVEIENLCKKLKTTYFRRQKASDTQSSADALCEVQQVMNKFDYVVEIMCTNPLKKVKDIDGVIEKLDETGADSVVSVVRIWDNHPSRVKYIENDKLKDFYPEPPESRRQDLTPAAYVRNGSIYAMTYEQLKIKQNRLGDDTRPYIMSEKRTINIDEPIDLELARIMLK
jgi:CMP-N,N'-diacetyllegionaminic acid synthase|tara:strand:+ start:636 stop:1307 length:672 start_codon:yes stop_codon:yes gene_type:complete